MKTTCSLLVSLGCLGLIHASAAPQLPSRYFVVCITEMDKTEKYEVLSADEFKQLSGDVKVEESFFPRAIECARAEWMKDETLKKKIFPKSAVSPRKVGTIGPPFTDQEKAQKKVDNISDAQSKRDERKRVQEEQRQRDANRGRGGKGDAPDKRDKEKEDHLRKAVDMVRMELGKLKDAALLKPAPGGATVRIPK